MLFFQKSKPILKDLIPNDYVDIHSHLLPGIDDGCKSFEETQNLILQLKNIGFSQFITTPHVMDYIWKNSSEKIENVLSNTKISLIENNIENPLNAAAEYMMDSGFINLFETQKLRTLKDNFVLVEMSYVNAPLNLYDILFQLQVAGYVPVLAHPERYSFYESNSNEFTKLKNAGCLFQMNLLSTVGYYGKNVSKTADYLLENNFYDFVGSDVHHQKHVASFTNKIILKNSELLEKLFLKNNFFRNNFK